MIFYDFGYNNTRVIQYDTSFFCKIESFKDMGVLYAMMSHNWEDSDNSNVLKSQK